MARNEGLVPWSAPSCSKSIVLQIDIKSQSVSASALRHSLQDWLSKGSGKSRSDEIYLKLRTGTGNMDNQQANLTSSQVGPQIKNNPRKQVQWTENMDQVLVNGLLEIVLAGSKRTEKGFKAEEFKKEKPDGAKMKGKLCPRYYDLLTVFGNDAATGDRAVSGNDFSPMSEPVDDLEGKNDVEETQPSHSTNSHRSVQGGPSQRRKRTKPMEDAALALSKIAKSSEMIVIAFDK